MLVQLLRIQKQHFYEKVLSESIDERYFLLLIRRILNIQKVLISHSKSKLEYQYFISKKVKIHYLIDIYIPRISYSVLYNLFSILQYVILRNYDIYVKRSVERTTMSHQHQSEVTIEMQRQKHLRLRFQLSQVRSMKYITTIHVKFLQHIMPYILPSCCILSINLSFAIFGYLFMSIIYSFNM